MGYSIFPVWFPLQESLQFYTLGDLIGYSVFPFCEFFKGNSIYEFPYYVATFHSDSYSQMELQNMNAAGQPHEVTETRLRSNTMSGKSKLKYLQFCEVLILTPVMLAIIGLYSLPTVFYALSKLEAEVRFDE